MTLRYPVHIKLEQDSIKGYIKCVGSDKKNAHNNNNNKQQQQQQQ